MKKFVYLSFLLLGLNAYSQDLASLKVNAQKAMDYTIAMDLNGLLDLTYPKVFTLSPREEVLKVLDQAFNGNPEFKIKMIPVAPNFNFGPIKKIEGHTFCVIKHNNAMEIKFTDKIENPDAIIEVFKSGLKADEVTFNPEKNSLTAKVVSTMVAIADESTKNQWTFLNNDNEGALFSTLFNEKIRTELGL